jgi:hypothetical protein
MSKPKLSGLVTALDRRNWQWLEEYYPDIASELDKAIAERATIEEIRLEMLSTIGEHRKAFIASCISAARHLESMKG